MSRTTTSSPNRRLPDWQCKGRCLDCGTKIAGCRRLRTCACGGRVSY
jgi:hypothetical protein